MEIYKTLAHKDNCGCYTPRIVDIVDDKFVCVKCKKEIKIEQIIKN